MKIEEPLIEIYLKINRIVNSKGIKSNELKVMKEQLNHLIKEQKEKPITFREYQPLGYFHSIDEELKEVSKDNADFVVLEAKAEPNYLVLFKTKDKNWDKPTYQGT